MVLQYGDDVGVVVVVLPIRPEDDDDEEEDDVAVVDDDKEEVFSGDFFVIFFLLLTLEAIMERGKHVMEICLAGSGGFFHSSVPQNCHVPTDT